MYRNSVRQPGPKSEGWLIWFKIPEPGSDYFFLDSFWLALSFRKKCSDPIRTGGAGSKLDKPNQERV